MPDATVTTQPQIARRCPACGRVSAASDRCLYCWRDIASVPPLPADEAATARTVRAGLARSHGPGRLTAGRIILYSLLGTCVALLAWWVYATFVDKPPRPDVPTSSVRAAVAGAWTTQGGSNGGTRSTTGGARLGGAEAWRVALGAAPATGLVTDGQILVATLQDSRLVGIDAASGKTLWTARLNNPPIAAPVIAGDRVYVAQREGVVRVLGASDGKEVWHSRFVAGSFEASPVVVDGVVYAYSTDGLFAFDAEDGRILWQQVFMAGWAAVTPVVEGKFLVITTSDRAVVYDRTEGRRTYFVTFSQTQPSSVSVHDGDVLAVYGRNATMFEATSRRPWWDGLRAAWFRFHLIGMAPAVPPPATLWDVTSLPRTTMAAALGPEVAVVASPDGDVTALGRSDGRPRWKVKVGRLAAAPMVTADGVLLAEEQRLVLLDTATGEQRGERSVPGLVDVVPAGAATYMATAAGDVIALR